MALKSSTGIGILQVPSEVTEHALIFAHPKDVASFAATCRFARSLVYECKDQHLWRHLFLSQSFDDPRKSLLDPATGELWSSFDNWKGELQRRVRATRVAQNIGDASLDVRCEVLQTFISVIMTTPSPSEVPGESSNLTWLSDVIEQSDMFQSNPSPWTRSDEETQLLARLRTYVGLSKEDQTGAHAIAMRTAARCFVYDLRNYTAENGYGPFIPDKSGHVNWRHIEAVVNVVAMNLKDLEGLWDQTRPPTGLEATRTYSAPGLSKRDPRDWAGVEGHWRRYVCFMDYRDLFAFNFSSVDSGPHNPSFFDDNEFREAVRLIEITLRLTHVVQSKNSRLPIIHFAGESVGAHGNEARVTGTVRMTNEGHIRWRFVSLNDGHSQWCSDGIQLGNAGSAMGVVGTWTGVHHEEGDPAGPFHLWKVDENHPRLVGNGHDFEDD